MFDITTSRRHCERGRFRPSRLLFIVLVAAGLFLSAGVPPATDGAHAASLQPRSLRLSATGFPAGALVKSGAAGNAKARAASLLHSASFDTSGRIDGYLQTARWTAGPRKTVVTMQYLVSIFSSDGEASTAATDARVSLWEAGRIISLSGLSTPGFLIAERGKRVEAFAVVALGPIETELSVRYPASLDARSSSALLRILGRDAAAASKLARPFVIPLQTLVDPNALPPLMVAPWGTGPVVKSPSLMAIGAPGTLWNVKLDSGLFRVAAPTLLSHVQDGVALMPGSRLSQFAREAVAVDGTHVYDSSALFASAQDAASAFAVMETATTKETWLQTVDLQTYLPSLPHLRTADAIRAWESGGETIVLVRQGNVIVTLASSNDSPAPLLNLANTVLSTVPTPLRAQGTSVADAAGMPIRLAGLNWYGTEQQDFVVGGLDARTYEDILRSIKQLGYNTIRVPVSNQVIERNPVVTSHVAANPDLSGMHALDILDRIISYAGTLGLRIILDDHRSDAGWSSQENGLWYTPQYPDSAFVNDWATLARRYAVNDVVVGADLRNEPHGSATWGDGVLSTDWRAAAGRAGNAVLAQNPHLLVIVEGIQFYGASTSYWWGGNLMGVATAPVVLQFPDGSSAESRLVYSAHDYGKDNCGTGCPWFNSTTSYASLSSLWDQYWGYIAADPSKSYAAPVWVGEFGTCNTQQSCVLATDPGSQGQWFSSMIRYIAERHLSWCYWSANGTQSTAPTRSYGDLDWYGLFSPSWLVPGPWVHPALQPIQIAASSTVTGKHTAR